MKTVKTGLCSVLVAVAAFAGHAASAAQCNDYYYGTELIDSVSFCASSYLPKSSVSNYVPANLSLFDASRAQAWCEGVPGAGKGEWIELQVVPGSTNLTLTVANGYQKSNASYANNARAKNVEISTDNGLYFTVRLADQPGDQIINLPDWTDFRRLRMTIKSVYPGTKYQDLCISAFGVDFEERREFEFNQMD